MRVEGNLYSFKQSHELLLRLALDLAHDSERPLVGTRHNYGSDLEMSKHCTDLLALNDVFLKIYELAPKVRL